MNDKKGDDDNVLSRQIVAVYRDEVKGKDKSKKQFLQQVDATVAVLRTVKNNPQLWSKDSLKELSNLVYEIAGQPGKYHSGKTKEQGYGKSVRDLTKNVGEALYMRTLSASTLDGNPVVLQITQVESTTVQCQIGSSTFTTKKWKFAAEDGNQIPILLRVDSTLNSAATLLKKGTVVSIASFNTVYFRYEDGEDLRCAMIAKDIEVVGYQPLSDEKSSERPRIAFKVKVKRQKISSDAGAAHNCQCGGRCCSKHGVDFVVCITECIPVNSISLELIARDCVFATREVGEMSNSDKRFLLYYYYATTVYQFHGKGNRVELPECLKTAVRALYPPEDIDMCVDEVEKVAYIINGDIEQSKTE